MHNFADDSDWSLVYDQRFQAVYLSRNPDQYIPISPLSLNGFALNFRYLKVVSENQNAKSTWDFGGMLTFLVNEPNASVEVLNSPLKCNRPVILSAPPILDSYQIRVKVPYWFDEVSLQIWGWTGDISLPPLGTIPPIIIGL
jgi:hypothetical protein